MPSMLELAPEGRGLSRGLLPSEVLGTRECPMGGMEEPARE